MRSPGFAVSNTKGHACACPFARPIFVLAFATYSVKVAAAHFGKPAKPSFAKPGAAPLAKFASVYLAKLATASASLL